MRATSLRRTLEERLPSLSGHKPSQALGSQPMSDSHSRPASARHAPRRAPDSVGASRLHRARWRALARELSEALDLSAEIGHSGPRLLATRSWQLIYRCPSSRCPNVPRQTPIYRSLLADAKVSASSASEQYRPVEDADRHFECCRVVVEAPGAEQGSKSEQARVRHRRRQARLATQHPFVCA